MGLSVVSAAEPIKVGLPLPLTGIHAKFGEAIRNAKELLENDHVKRAYLGL